MSSRDRSLTLAGSILVVFLVNPLVSGNSCEDTGFHPEKKGQYFRHHVIDTMTTQTVSLCRIMCYLQESCMSYNYQPTNGSCELSGSDETEHPHDLVSSPDHVYVRRKNPCEKNPCPVHHVCKPNFKEESRTCSCSPGYKGPNCRKDVDECKTGQHDCSPNATCINIIGSYDCTCKDGYFGNGTTCSKITNCTIEKALGMESRAIPDSAITASSAWGGKDFGHKARLNNNPDHWAPSSSRVGEWLQVDFGKLTFVSKVATQGRPTPAPSYITSYSLSYRRENESWKSYVHAFYNGTLPGNVNYNEIITNTLDPKIATRYIRIYPKTWQPAITMRVEFYGCYLSG